MKRLFKYAEKIGASIRPEGFGQSYFYNAPALHFCGAIVCCDIRDRTEAKIADYCKRYGYSVQYHGFPGYHVLWIMRQEDADALALYHEFMNKSVSACEKAIHERHEGLYSYMNDSEFNDYLCGIMEFYGEEYNEAKKVASAA